MKSVRRTGNVRIEIGVVVQSLPLCDRMLSVTPFYAGLTSWPPILEGTMVKVGEAGQPAAARTELAAILACTHDAVVGVTPSGVINRWNPAAAALYGCPAEEIVGRHLDNLVPPERRDGDAQILRRVLQSGQTELISAP